MYTLAIHKRKFFLLLLIFIDIIGFAQNVLYSPYSDYLRITDLTGNIELETNNLFSYSIIRNNLSNIKKTSLWNKKIFDGLLLNSLLEIEPINTFFSYNSEYPHGFNDTSLWQGVGGNGYLQAGISGKFKKVTIILSPVFTISQNNEYETMPADDFFDSEYAYFLKNIDLPQRFGAEMYKQLSWGQSEVRYKNDFIQIGFGYQNLWLGPSTQNPILLSNSANGFPKIDIGLKDSFQYIGAIDVKAFWGRLTESVFFNNIESDNHNFISGLFLCYSPAFIPGFTLGLNRVKLTPWENLSFSEVLSIFDPESDSKYGRDSSDQRASITGEWKYRDAGFRGYFEWARNDYSPGLRDNILLEPSHSQAFTIGFEQVLVNRLSHILSMNAEITQLIHTRDYEIGLGMGQTGFYTHHIITQGYTNEGQMLGAGIGPGAESQYLGVQYFNSKGSILFFIRRLSRNKDYIYGDPDRITGDLLKLNVELTGGVRVLYFILPDLHLTSEINLSRNLNWNYIENNDKTNIYLSLNIKKLF